MQKIISALKNKYVLTLLILSIWILFFDKNDVKTQIEFKKEVKQLEEERNYFAKENADITRDLKDLTNNQKTIEKFGREKYLMKRDNEDIFVIVEEKE